MICPRRTRRHFLLDSGTALAGALLYPTRSFAGSAIAQPAAAPQPSATTQPGVATYPVPATDAASGGSAPHIDFPAAARDRIAVASYPFRQFITPMDPGDTEAASASSASAPQTSAPAKMELKDFAAHVVEKFKINKIEPWSVHFRSHEAQYLAEIRAAFDKAQVSVVNIAVDGEHSIYAADPAERERAVAESESWIDVAVAIGSPSVRTHLAEAKDSGPNMQRAAECLRRVAEYGASKNVVVNLENDNPVTEDAFFVAKLAATVQSPWLHALPDFGNSLAAMSTAQAYDAIDAMFSQAYNICHVKALEVNGNGEKYHVDLKRTFKILRHYNYKGFCSMEFDSPGDPYAGTADLIKETVQYLS
jgi:sugar phosphate isomerase/epimerase